MIDNFKWGKIYKMNNQKMNHTYYVLFTVMEFIIFIKN